MTSSMTLIKNQDDYYCVSFKTDTTPVLDDYKNKFLDYRLLVRVHPDGKVVYLRSRNEEDLRRCMSKFEKQYDFRVVTSSKMNKDRINSDLDASFSSSEVQSIVAPVESKQHMILSNKEAEVYHVIFTNLPKTTSMQDILDLCADISVCPALIETDQSNLEKYVFISVFVKSEEDAKKLCSTYNNYNHKDKVIVVKTADQIMTEAANGCLN